MPPGPEGLQHNVSAVVRACAFHDRTDTTRQYARCCVCYDLIPEERKPGIPQFCGSECAAVHIQRLDDHYQSQTDAVAQTAAKLLDGPANEGV